MIRINNANLLLIPKRFNVKCPTINVMAVFQRILYIVQNPEKQSSERTRSRLGQNPERKKSRLTQNPEWTKSRIGQKLEWTKSQNALNPEWKKLRIG